MFCTGVSSMFHGIALTKAVICHSAAVPTHCNSLESLFRGMFFLTPCMLEIHPQFLMPECKLFLMFIGVWVVVYLTRCLMHRLGCGSSYCDVGSLFNTMSYHRPGCGYSYCDVGGLFFQFHFISFHFISFHFISFHFISFHFISFHFISLFT